MGIFFYPVPHSSLYAHNFSSAEAHPSTHDLLHSPFPQQESGASPLPAHPAPHMSLDQEAMLLTPVLPFSPPLPSPLQVSSMAAPAKSLPDHGKGVEIWVLAGRFSAQAAAPIFTEKAGYWAEDICNSVSNLL